MNEDFEQESEAAVSSPETIEVTPIPSSPEELIHDIDARVETFSGLIIPARERAREMGLKGGAVESMTTTYEDLSGLLLKQLGRARDIAKTTIASGVIALAAMPALADNGDTERLTEAVTTYAQADEHNPSTDESPNVLKEVVPDELRLPQEEAENEAAKRRAAAAEQPAEIPHASQEGRYARRIQKSAEMTTDLVSGVLGQDGVKNFVDKHAGFIAENIIPGAGIKHAITGVDAYGEKLTNWERAAKFGEGVLEIGTLGKSKLLKQISSLWKAKEAGAELAKERNSSNAASAVGAVAGMIPGARSIKNIAEVTSVVTDPDIQKIGGILKEVVIDGNTREDNDPRGNQTESAPTRNPMER